MTNQVKRWVFGAVCIVASGAAALYMTRGAAPSASPTEPSPMMPLERLDPGRPGILFVNMIPGPSFGKVAFVPMEAVEGPALSEPREVGGERYITTLRCDRVYFQASHGVCLTLEDTLLPPYAWSVFDESFRPAGKQPLTGVPSRTRLSHDGRRAAMTVFESGHSYAQDGFSTRTTLVDTLTSTRLGDLEEFTTWRDNAIFRSVDFNFWGVTFARDGNLFYATLRTARTNYLVEGDVDRRRMRVIRAGVECPSISPDNKRLAFKKRVGDNTLGQWQVAILDLSTMHETVLDSEQRSVDDQVEWLDNNHVLYHQTGADGASVWVLRTDRPEPPRLLIRAAYSPTVVR